MLFFEEDGRLGNQIFQYVALMSMCLERESVILLEFRDLQLLFDGLKAKIINQATKNCGNFNCIVSD